MAEPTDASEFNPPWFLLTATLVAPNGMVTAQSLLTPAVDGSAARGAFALNLLDGPLGKQGFAVREITVGALPHLNITFTPQPQAIEGEAD